MSVPFKTGLHQITTPDVSSSGRNVAVVLHVISNRALLGSVSVGVEHTLRRLNNQVQRKLFGAQVEESNHFKNYFVV